MDNFCGKCGTRLDEKTGRCPKCNKQAKNLRIFWLVAIVLVIALALMLTGMTLRSKRMATPVDPPQQLSGAEEGTTETEVPRTEPSQTVPVETTKAPEAYIDIYLDLLQNEKFQNCEAASGDLSDLNSDNIPELTISFAEKNEAGTVNVFYSLYTVTDGHLKPLIENEEVYTVGKGVYGGVNFLKENGENVFIVYQESASDTPNGPNGSYHSEGKWQTFTWDGEELKCSQDVEFSMYSTLTEKIRSDLVDIFSFADTWYQILEEDFHATLNGAPMSYRDYHSLDRARRLFPYLDAFNNRTLQNLAEEIMSEN